MNPLHVYCRLRDMGIKRSIALHVCRVYERVVFKKFLFLTLRGSR
ncbi:conserved hypothetical protein [uncultured Desulfobacterium sp.]|uniref:Uncharacterized protein n=1 Tax=uncultured Desulfobacterium sp. TaxID=201089 RepID=A0A445N333_9BACT|nr:conserved hypothetical protein [uncultured Desulfobacterium sp.]